jgi:hypothetical protein
MAYEYKILSCERPTVNENQLNEFGADRWQLVAVYEMTDQWVYVFMRHIAEETDEA